jgi:hypothetical protein
MDNTSPVGVRGLLADAPRILKAWKANPEFRMKDATVADFQVTHAAFSKVLRDLGAKGRELTELRKVRNKTAVKLNELCTRVRSGMRGFYGPNSSQYKQTFGIRVADRKKPARKGKPSQPA